MCKVIEKFTDSEVAFGYKIAIKSKDGKYYSPYTGYEYVVGKINVPEEYMAFALSARAADKLQEKYTFAKFAHRVIFSSHMKNKTGVILDAKDANSVLFMFETNDSSTYNYVILQMEITGDLYKAEFNYFPTVIGNEILQIKGV